MQAVLLCNFRADYVDAEPQGTRSDRLSEAPPDSSYRAFSGMLPHQCLCLTQKCDYRRFVLAAQTTTTEAAQSLLIFSEDRNIFYQFSRMSAPPILCLLRRSF